MNEILLIVEAVLTFGTVAIVARFFGKEGLSAWIAIALILANITVSKSVVMFGIDATLGNVMFASTFLATDVLAEKYGNEAARQGVYIGILGAAAFIVCTQFALLYAPSQIDVVSGQMADLFAINIRTMAASVAMCMVANLADVWLFGKIKKATAGKYLWLRNNVATMTCNCLENFAFIFLAFAGIFTVQEMLIIAVSSSIIEAILAVIDTPFVYIAVGRSNDRSRKDMRERSGSIATARD